MQNSSLPSQHCLSSDSQRPKALCSACAEQDSDNTGATFLLAFLYCQRWFWYEIGIIAIMQGLKDTGDGAKLRMEPHKLMRR